MAVGRSEEPIERHRSTRPDFLLAMHMSLNRTGVIVCLLAMACTSKHSESASVVGRYVGGPVNPSSPGQRVMLDISEDGYAHWTKDTTYRYPYAVRGDTVWLSGVGQGATTLRLLRSGDSLIVPELRLILHRAE
jgi:hypothetical protein